MKKISSSFLYLFAGLIIAFAMQACKSKKKQPPVFDPEFSNYITEYTSGVISSGDVIRLRLVSPVDSTKFSPGPVDMDLFSFDPVIEGNAYLIDERTFEFRPESRLEYGTVYDAFFQVGEVVETPTDLDRFPFQFQTIQLSLEMHDNGLHAYFDEPGMVWLSGTIVSSDRILGEQLEKIVKAKLDDKEVAVKWQHQADRNTHNFRIDSIKRENRAKELLISWDGKISGVKLEGSDTLEIPSIEVFKVMGVEVKQGQEQEVVIRFSDPLDPDQNLDGLVRLYKASDLNCIIDGNTIRAYPEGREGGSVKLIIEQSIKSVFGKRLDDPYSIYISFDEIKPDVRFLSDGAILPREQGLIVPFEAVNLEAIDVSVIKVYEDNIGQFLQVNRFQGDDQLRRVGRPVLNKKITLKTEKPLDYGQWNTFSLDLTEFIQRDPGAMYRIQLKFRPSYSLYYCSDDPEFEEEEEDWDSTEQPDSYWDNSEYYYYYYPQGYDWRERDNPCHVSYYTGRRFPSKNIIASDLGIVAKKMANNRMKVMVSDLLNTEPLADVEIELYSYQQQLLGKSRTNAQGMADIDLNAMPYYLIAKKGKQKGYLRLDDGSSLSLSKFDVAGQAVEDGLKGFLYGDRGVWRPGDSLYLTFILQDEQKIIPENHPVVFELRNPEGKLVQRKVQMKGLNGFYDFRTATASEAPTGNWSAKVKVGGAEFYKRLKIETVKPNRLKINLDFGKEEISVADPDIKAKLKVNWLTGATARKLKATIDMTLTTAPTSFEGYENYDFTDPSKTFYPEEENVFDGRIDEEGLAEFSLDVPEVESAPGMLNASFITKVFEEGGEFSIDYYKLKYAPYKSFVGVMMPEGDRRGMLLTDTTHTVSVATVDPEGNPVGVDDLSVKIYKLEWRWWWDASSDDLASYFGRNSRRPVLEKEISTKDGKGEFDFRIDYPEWGRYFVHIVDESSGHSTGKTFYVDWPGWAGKPKRQDQKSSTMLVFQADKEKYESGEKCTITFPSSGHGRALVSLETGSEVVQAFWVQPQSDQTKFTFDVTSEMAPNVYVNITLVQPYAQTKNDAPIRLYGVIPVLVEDPKTILHPGINMSEVIEPESDFTVKVEEKNNRPMTYTIAIVDEGLLDLTRFKTPSPWNYFYAREALGVKSWDMYNDVIGAYGGTIEQMFAIGGDGEGDDTEAKKQVNRFKPVVMYAGPFELVGGTAEHSFSMPNYVGSVRTMVVAGYDQAYGSTQETTPVKKPLMVLATLPRVLGPTESVQLPVTVFAMEDDIKKVDVKVDANEYFELEEDLKTLNFEKTGDQVVNFSMKVKEKVGVGKVHVEVSSGNETATYDIEIEIRNPNPPVTQTYDGVMEAGKSWTGNYTLPGIEGTNEASFTVSGLPPMNLEKRMRYLTSYPYGCSEQVTSSVFPQLFLKNVMELSNEEKMRISENIKQGINKLKAMQLSKGGLGYWSNATMAGDWVTSYAGHFMLEAEKQGYMLPIGFKDQWIRFQKTASREWSLYKSDYRGYQRQSALIQAYRLYTLALAGQADMGAMNRLKEARDISMTARWVLAAAYAEAGQPEVAREISGNLGMDIETYAAMSETYGSSIRDQAFILLTYTLLDEKDKALPILKKLADQLSSNRWYSTQTTAFSLLAITKFAGKSDNSGKDIYFEYTLNDEEQEEVRSQLPVYQQDIGTENKTGKLVIENLGKSLVYGTITLTGQPAIGEETAAGNNLGLKVKYTDMEGKEVDISSMQQGTDFMAHVTVTNPGLLGYYKDMALSQIFPSGWEIINMRLADLSPVHESNKPTYQDIRDDRVYTFFDLGKGDSKTFTVLLNSTYLGRFYLPGISCEAMYDNSISARTAGQWVEVVPYGQ